MLYEHVKASGVCRLAIVGLAKHAGKTTALNTLIREASIAGIPLSVQSIGVDGERFDSLIGVAKPVIWVPAGTVVATAADALIHGTAKLQLLEATGISSTMGEIFITRVVEAGNVLLTGVRQVEYAKDLFIRMERWGARLQLLDGAFDRMASGASALVDGIVLCTGASVGRSVKEVVAKTKEAIARLQIPVIEQGWEQELSTAARNSGWTAIGGSDLSPIVLSGFNLYSHHPFSHPAWTHEAYAMAVPGAVTDPILKKLEGVVQTLIVQDGTCMLASLPVWKGFERKGTKIFVENPIRIVAVTVNATSVENYRLPRNLMLEEIRNVCNGLPVVDCLFPDSTGESH